MRRTTKESVPAFGRLSALIGPHEEQPAVAEPDSREAQARAAEELNLLPDGSTIAEMLSDYAVLRDQTRSCSI